MRQQLRSSRTIRYATPLRCQELLPWPASTLIWLHSPFSILHLPQRISLSLILPICASTASFALGSTTIFAWMAPARTVCSFCSLPAPSSPHKKKTEDRIAFAAIPPPDSFRPHIASPPASSFPTAFLDSLVHPLRKDAYCLLFDCYCCRLPNCLSVCLSSAAAGT